MQHAIDFNDKILKLYDSIQSRDGAARFARMIAARFRVLAAETSDQAVADFFRSWADTWADTGREVTT